MTVLTAKKRRIWPYLLILALALAAGILLLWRQAGGRYGHLQVRVVDAYTLAPIEGVYVAIPDQDRALSTDEAGSASFMGLAIRENPALASLAKQGWGECTLLAVKEGYRPTVLFYAHIYQNQVRRSTLYMFPVEKDGEEIITMSETPDEEWLKEFVEENSP